MKFFQNFAPQFLKKECETTTNDTYRCIGLSPSRWHRARTHRVRDNAIHLTLRSFIIRNSSFPKQLPSVPPRTFPRAIRQLPDHSNHHNTSHGWPREWSPQTTIRKQLINT